MTDQSLKPTLNSAVNDAASRDEVAGALDAVYRTLDRRTAARRPKCDRSGACCRLEEYGHRLFVTTIELAVFLRELRDRPGDPSRPWDGTGCPYQKSGLCSVHPFRPFGCRLFFCDPTSADWQEQTYRELHDQLRILHDSLDVPYFYVEWRQGLVQLGLSVLSGAVVKGGSRRLPVLSRETRAL